MLLIAVLNCSKPPIVPSRSHHGSGSSPGHPISRQAFVAPAAHTPAGHLVSCSVHLTLTISISFHEGFIITVVKGCGIFLPAARILALNSAAGGAATYRAIRGQ